MESPPSMVDYANRHFKTCLPSKGIKEKILTEYSALQNLQKVKSRDDSVKILFVSLSSIRLISNGTISGRILPFMGPLL